MKAKRVLASFIAMAMTMGMMSSLVLADKSENAPEETSVVETTEPKEKETKKPAETKAEEPEEKKPVETSAADPEEKKPEETVKETEPTESEDKKPAETAVPEPSQTEATEPAESEKEEPSEPAETEPETTAVPENGKREDSHAVPPKNDQVPSTEITSVTIWLEKPVAGAKPDYTALFPSDANYYSESFSNEYYKNYIRWLDVNTNSFMYKDSGVFEAEHEYQVVLFLTAKDSFSFATGTSAKVNGNNAKTSIDEEGHLRVSYNFPKLPQIITSASITIDAPVAGAKPDCTAVLPSGVNYYIYSTDSSSVVWVDESIDKELDPDNSVFKAGHQYTVYVTLIGKEGYTFLSSSTAKVNGQSAKTTMWTEEQFLVQFTFPVLEGDTNNIISLVSVELDTPMAGAKPDYTAVLPSGANYYSKAYNHVYYRNNMSWKDNTSDCEVDPDSGVFISGHQYEVTIFLTPKAGYEFTNSTTATVNGQTASARLVDGELIVNYTFEIEGVATDVIASASIKLDSPVIGERPDYEAVFPSGANYYSADYIQNDYRNSIRWYDVTANNAVNPDSEVFKAGHQYKVTVFLTSNSGYYFSESTTATLNGQTANVSHSSRELKVDYTFPVLGEDIGFTTTVDGNNYTITNNRNDGTGTVTLIGVSVSSASVSIPATVVIKGYVYKVNRIGAKAFYGDKIIKTVGIGSNVNIIDANAFYGCSNLTKVSGGKALKTIGANAFARCPKLSSFVITSTVLSKIGTYAFNKDSKLKTISIKNTTKLTKSGVKKSLKGSKVKTVKVKKSKIKKYKKIFKKKNSGRSVKVKK